MLAAPHLIQLPHNVPAMVHALGFLQPHGRPETRCWFLALVCANPGFRGYLESEPRNGKTLSYVSPSVTLSKKKFF